VEVDLELYRQEIRLASQPPARLSVIDVAPDLSQRTLVFLHGYGGQAIQWGYQLRHFSNTDRTIAIDLRGHGRSDKPAGRYDMPQILSDLQSVLDALGVADKAVLVGHSFGGAVAVEYACAYPERVSHLVLIASTGEYRLNPFYRLLLNLPYPVIRLLAPFTRNWLGAPPHVLKAWYQDSISRWNGWSLFRSLSLPTLVIRGHHDRVFERPLFEEVTRAIPHAEEVDVGASGHMVMLERRQAVNRSISRFLEQSQLSWRETASTNDDLQHNALLRRRPWLPHYDETVPFTIAVPRVPLHYLLRSAVRRFPNHAALVFEGARLHYSRLNQEINCFAHAVLRLGLNKGDRILLWLPNLPQMVIAFFGTLKAGGAAVFTLPNTQPEELARQFRDCGARILVTLDQFYDQVQQVLMHLGPEEAHLEHIIYTDAGDYLPTVKWLAWRLKRQKAGLPPSAVDGRTHDLRRLIREQSSEAPQVSVTPHDLAVIIYTGGTTDLPKGVMLSHYNLVANALQTRHWIPDAQEGGERFLCVLPFSHSYGLTTTLNVPIALGAALILKATFEVGDILKTIRRYKPTIFPGVPQMYVTIKDFPNVRRYGIRSIKACISGSAPLPVEVQEAFEKLTRGRLVEGYGLTEASPVTHGNPLNGLRKVGSIGIPLPSTEARVVDLRRGKREVQTGQIGELAVRGPQVMMGYWGLPEETRRVLSSDGWLLTGDVAQMDADGYFRIVARKADMWYPSKPGEPAFPRDVEEVLFEIPQVKEAAVVAIAGQPVAFIIARKERPTAEALIAYCRRRLPPELVPRLVLFVDDFPRTFIGKVLRRELARRFNQNPAQANIEKPEAV